ncbi:relaxase/mobilization nuclease, partial [Streptomyces acidiscabies]
MIPRLHKRDNTPHGPLFEALGPLFSPAEALGERVLVAHWAGLDDYTLHGERKTWSADRWADHLEEPLLENPFAASQDDDRRAILHLEVRLHPDDRELTGPQWAHVARRFARAAGIEIPGEEDGCHWIAVRARPGRLDLIANMIHLDGAWHSPPTDVVRRLAQETRSIEQDLRLVPVRSGPTAPPAGRPAPTASVQFAGVLTQLADEQDGPLAAVRGLVEHTAHQLARRPEGAG